MGLMLAVLTLIIVLLAPVAAFSPMGRGTRGLNVIKSGHGIRVGVPHVPVLMSSQQDSGDKKMKGMLKSTINTASIVAERAVNWIRALVIKVLKITWGFMQQALNSVRNVARMSVINGKDALVWATFFCGSSLKNVARAIIVNLFKLGVRSGLLGDSDDYDDAGSEDAYGSALSIGKSVSVISSGAAASAAAGAGRKYSTPAAANGSGSSSGKSEELPSPEEQYRMKIEADRKKVKDRMKELSKKETERKAEAQRVAASLAATLAQAEAGAGAGTEVAVPVIPSPSPAPVPVTPAAAAVTAVQPEAVVIETATSTRVELPTAPARAPAPAADVAVNMAVAASSSAGKTSAYVKVEDIEGVEQGSGSNLDVPSGSAVALTEAEAEGEGESKELTLGEKITKAGTAGTVSYVLTELAFWAISIPFIVQSYHSSTGEWLDFTNAEERVRILGLTAGFVSTARLAVPLRLGVALFMAPSVSERLTENNFLQREVEEESEEGA